jgi:hypothetical protein
MKSGQESRFAKLLEFLVATGDVLWWRYEPHKFRCKRMYNRIRLYTPDFLVAVNTDRDIFDTGTKCVWVEVKAALDPNGKARLRCLVSTYPHLKDKLILVVERNPAGRRSKTAARQRVLQDAALSYVSRIVYGNEWYKQFGL